LVSLEQSPIQGQTQAQLQPQQSPPITSDASQVPVSNTDEKKSENTAPKAKFLQELKDIMAESSKPKEKTLEEKKKK